MWNFAGEEIIVQVEGGILAGGILRVQLQVPSRALLYARKQGLSWHSCDLEVHFEALRTQYIERKQWAELGTLLIFKAAGDRFSSADE